MRTKSIRSFLVFLLGMHVATSSNAQTSTHMDAPHAWSLGMNMGMSDLWGDVGTRTVTDHYFNKNYSSNLHFMGGMVIRYTLHPAFSLRLNINYGTLYANDNWNETKAKKTADASSDYVQRYIRNQDIRDLTWEGDLMFEFEPLRMNPESKGAHRAGQPYIGAGIGYFHYQPYSTLDGSWQRIANLHLEGDGFNFPGAPKKVDLAQMCVPIAIGYRFDIGKKINVGVEYMYRLCFTDYLDGVSGAYIDPKLFDQNLTPNEASLAKQLADKTRDHSVFAGLPRGNKSNNDSYSTISITFFYKVKSRNKPWWE